MKRILILTLLIGLLISFQISLAQDPLQCLPHISVVSDLLTQAQSKFDGKDVQAGLNILDQAQNQLSLQIAGCLNYAPDMAGNKRSNPVKYGDWQNVTVGEGEKTSVQISDFIANADPETTVGKAPDAGKKYVAFRVNMHCENSADDYCALDSLTGISIVGSSGAEYINAHINKLQDANAPSRVYGTGDLTRIYVFAINTNETNLELKFAYNISHPIWFATQ